MIRTPDKWKVRSPEVVQRERCGKPSHAADIIVFLLLEFMVLFSYTLSSWKADRHLSRSGEGTNELSTCLPLPLEESPLMISGPLFSDQTPTPTRFLKNCEEVGLFSELDCSFEHEFRKAQEEESSKRVGLLGWTPREVAPEHLLETSTWKLGSPVNYTEVNLEQNLI